MSGHQRADPVAATEVAETLEANRKAANAGLLATELASGSGASSPDSELREGDLAGDYRIVRRIGGGAMGDVYEGTAEAIGKRVAIKVLKNVAASTEAAAERFLREARAVNKINHANVLDVFAYGTLADGRLFLVMDLLTGENLGERIRRTGAIAETEFLALVAPICRALDAAHTAGIVHRDLKPENIFLADRAGDTHVYVLDFGIAKLLSDVAEAEGQVTLTGEGVWIGTPAYMSPEQWAAEPTTPQTDIYALGCTAFEMLTGQVPFKADSVPGIMQKHFNEEPPPITRDGRSVPTAFERAVTSALAKEPSDRPASALEFLGELEGASPSVGRETGSRMRIWAAAAALVAFAALAVVWFAGRSDTHNGKNLEHNEESQMNATDPGQESGRTWSITITATPPWATVEVDGYEPAVERLELTGLASGASITAIVTAPGYTRREAVFDVGDGRQEALALVRVDQFGGVWRLADGSLRLLDHGADHVNIFRLPSIEADPEFLRDLKFSPIAASSKSNVVRFGGKTTHYDQRAPDSKSCSVELASQYRYDPVRDKLELRRETVGIRFHPPSRSCSMVGRHMLEWEQAERVRYAETEVRWAVSRGGSGGLQRFITKEPQRVPLPIAKVGQNNDKNNDKNVGKTVGNIGAKAKPTKKVTKGKTSALDASKRERKLAKEKEADEAQRAKEADSKKSNKANAASKEAPQAKDDVGAANPSRPKDAPNAPAAQGIQRKE